MRREREMVGGSELERVGEKSERERVVERERERGRTKGRKMMYGK